MGGLFSLELELCLASLELPSSKGISVSDCRASSSLSASILIFLSFISILIWFSIIFDALLASSSFCRIPVVNMFWANSIGSSFPIENSNCIASFSLCAGFSFFENFLGSVTLSLKTTSLVSDLTKSSLSQSSTLKPMSSAKKSLASSSLILGLSSFRSSMHILMISFTSSFSTLARLIGFTPVVTLLNIWARP